MFELYALLNPNNLEIKYIGFTSRPKNRLKEHISSALCYKQDEYNSHKSKWIRKIIKENKKPIYKTLFYCKTIEEVKKLEIDHIKYYKKYFKLTNGTEGGDGTKGLKISEKAKKHLSELYKGIPKYNLRYKVEVLHSITGEYKIFNDKEEASKFLNCKPETILQANNQLKRKRVYGWYINTIKKGAQ